MIKLKVKVRTYGDLKRVLGVQFTLTLRDDAPLKELVSKLREKIGTKKGLLDHNLLSPTLMVLVNGRNIHSLDGLDTCLRTGDIVTFIPLVEGG